VRINDVHVTGVSSIDRTSNFFSVSSPMTQRPRAADAVADRRAAGDSADVIICPPSPPKTSRNLQLEGLSRRPTDRPRRHRSIQETGMPEPRPATDQPGGATAPRGASRR
jgi:hypothetical protein